MNLKLHLELITPTNTLRVTTGSAKRTEDGIMCTFKYVAKFDLTVIKYRIYLENKFVYENSQLERSIKTKDTITIEYLIGINPSIVT